MDPLVLLIACAIGVIPAVIARKKGRNTLLWWIYGSALFVVALPHSLLLVPDQDAVDAARLASGGRRCPYCAEIVRREAVVCRYCGRDLDAIETQPATSLPGFEELAAKYETWALSRTPAALADFASSLHRQVRDDRWSVSAESIREVFPEANGIPEFEDVVRRL